MSNDRGMRDRGLTWHEIRIFFVGVAVGMLVFFAATRGNQLKPIELLGFLATVVALVVGFLAYLDASETKQLINDIRVQLAWTAGQLAILTGVPGSYEIPFRTSR